MKQIRDGCGNPDCTKPSCYSCRKRLARSPLRKYTLLSAKPLALDLVNRPDPLAQLCPHIVTESESSTNHAIPTHHCLSEPTTPSSESKGKGHQVCLETSPRKDPKSFSQKLFNTFDLDRLDITRSEAHVDCLSTLTPELLHALGKLHFYQNFLSPMSPLEANTNREHRLAVCDYVNQSIFYSFARIDTVLKIAGESFIVDKDEYDATKPESFLKVIAMYRALEEITSHYAMTIFDSLWEALSAVFVKPRVLSNKKKKQPSRFLSDEQAASLISLCIYALAAAIDPDELVDHKADEIEGLRYPNFLPLRDENATWHAERLAGRVALAIHARNNLQLARSKMFGDHPPRPFFALLTDTVAPDIVASRREREEFSDRNTPYLVPVNMFFRWTKLLFVQTWDRSSVVQSGTSAASHLHVLLSLCMHFILPQGVTATNLCLDYHRQLLDLSEDLFRISAVSDAVNLSQVPSEWSSNPSELKASHLLQVPFLFTASKLISCFRAVNLSKMTRAFISARTTVSMPKRLAIPLTEGQANTLSGITETTQNAHLVLEIRRGCELQCALDQLWQREKEELLRPLKVRYVGESGFDIGGVSQEFFRMVFMAALDPEYGKQSSICIKNLLVLGFDCDEMY